MLTQLRLTNYQSHRDTHLELGQFTVILGTSSSGKTSLIRGLKLLVSNARGTSYVRHGARLARVWGAFAVFEGDPLEAQIQVAIERGPGTSVYELTIPDQDLIRFTKCGTTVPDIVKAAHDLGEDELWVAGQFDRPFLLDETGSKVAKVLGDLTNVSMIFAAVRECNRRALEAKRKLLECNDELSQSTRELQSYISLPVKLTLCSEAESALQRALSLMQRRELLSTIYSEVISTRTRVCEIRSSLRSVPSLELLTATESYRSRLAEMVCTVEAAALRRTSLRLVPIPDLRRLDALSGRRTALQGALSAVSQSEVSRRQASELSARAYAALEEARASLASLLTESGMCPTCGALSEHSRLDCISVN